MYTRLIMVALGIALLVGSYRLDHPTTTTTTTTYHDYVAAVTYERLERGVDNDVVLASFDTKYHGDMMRGARLHCEGAAYEDLTCK